MFNRVQALAAQLPRTTHRMISTAQVPCHAARKELLSESGFPGYERQGPFALQVQSVRSKPCIVTPLISSVAPCCESSAFQQLANLCGNSCMAISEIQRSPSSSTKTTLAWSLLCVHCGICVATAEISFAGQARVSCRNSLQHSPMSSCAEAATSPYIF